MHWRRPRRRDADRKGITMENKILEKLENENFQSQPVESKKAHWIIQRDSKEILWLAFDKKNSGANTLASDVLQELDGILQDIEKMPPKAVVLHSAKQKGFCAGADIKEFQRYSESEMISQLQRGHMILDRLEKLEVPTVAVVHGHCLGGGLELALACDKRIGVKGELEIGFPEVRLGVHPGLGGTFRLTKLIDPLVAMQMMLTGKSAYEEQTRKRGLVDILVERRHIENAVQAAIADKPKKRRQSFKGFILNNLSSV